MSGRLVPTPPVTPPVTLRVTPPVTSPESLPTQTSQTDTALVISTQTDASEPSLMSQAPPDSPLAATHEARGSESMAMPHTAPAIRDTSVSADSNATPVNTAVPATRVRSVAELKVAALAGDANAQFRLANRFYRGLDVPKNYEEALSWYIKAAEQGHVDAQNNLAYMYSEGEGGKKDEALAFHWYLSAASQDSATATAQYNVGQMYENGEGVTKDDALAFNWYQKAATHADPEAQYQVGMMYQSGQGVKEDWAMAHIYLSKAANQGFAAAQYEMAMWCEYGCSKAGLKLDKAMAFTWYQKAADQGYVRAQTHLGYMYEWGEAHRKDYAQAVNWYRKAADQGDLGGQSALALMYEKGLGVTQNVTTAVYWFSKAAEQGDKYSQDRLSEAYKVGVGVEKDLKLAAYWQLKCNTSEEGNTIEGARLDYCLSGGMIELIIQHLKETPDFQNVTQLKFPKNKFSGDDIAGISQLIRANLPFQNLEISSFNSIGNINSRLLVEAMKFNTQLTNFRFGSFFDSINFDNEIDALLERNAGIAELRLYVKEHQLIQTAGFPLELVSLLVDEMIVSSLRGGQTKEVTKEAIDAVLLSASIKPLQEETKI